MKTNMTQAQLDEVNNIHWASDYKDSVQPRDTTLRRRLLDRATPEIKAAIAAGEAGIAECGPCAMFGFELRGK